MNQSFKRILYRSTSSTLPHPFGYSSHLYPFIDHFDIRKDSSGNEELSYVSTDYFFVFFHIPRYSEETRYFLSIIAIHRLPWGCVFLQFFIISFVNNYFLLFLDILLVRISMNYCFLLEMCSIVIDLEL